MNGERKRMVKRVKRVLVLGVLALFAALVYAEGEQETGATKESGVTVREEKSKSSTLSKTLSLAVVMIIGVSVNFLNS